MGGVRARVIPLVDADNVARELLVPSEILIGLDRERFVGG